MKFCADGYKDFVWKFISKLSSLSTSFHCVLCVCGRTGSICSFQADRGCSFCFLLCCNFVACIRCIWGLFLFSSRHLLCYCVPVIWQPAHQPPCVYWQMWVLCVHCACSACFILHLYSLREKWTRLPTGKTDYNIVNAIWSTVLYIFLCFFYVRFDTIAIGVISSGIGAFLKKP